MDITCYKKFTKSSGVHFSITFNEVADMMTKMMDCLKMINIMIVRLNYTPKDPTHIFQMTKFWSRIVFLSNFNLPKTFNAFELTCLSNWHVFCVLYYNKLWKSVIFLNLKLDREIELFGWFRQFPRFYVLRVVSVWHWYSRVDSNMNGIPSNVISIRSPFHTFSERTCGNFDSFKK